MATEGLAYAQVGRAFAAVAISAKAGFPCDYCDCTFIPASSNDREALKAASQQRRDHLQHAHAIITVEYVPPVHQKYARSNATVHRWFEDAIRARAAK